jgi:hypothetical protein
MQLNLPILDQLKDSQNILIAGAGGGFDVFAGLPVYFTLRDAGKNVHLANFSFTHFELAKVVSDPIDEIPGVLMGARSGVRLPLNYFPEGYLSEWFALQQENVTVWMIGRAGVVQMAQAYVHLVQKLNIDALILVDGGVDSLMHGDEEAPGTLIEDSMTLAAIENLDIPVKLLACIGFGTEMEESVCHHHALENIASLAKTGGFLGSCALLPQMTAFQRYEAACRYVWEQPGHHKSHISTRIIPAVHGEFGDFRMYPDERYSHFINLLVSPLMSLYWFFEAGAVIQHNLLVPLLRDTQSAENAMSIGMSQHYYVKNKRPRRSLPY